MIIGLFGFDFISSNKGCEALTYVEYRIPLDTVDITDTIRAAKKFAGLE